MQEQVYAAAPAGPAVTLSLLLSPCELVERLEEAVAEAYVSAEAVPWELRKTLQDLCRTSEKFTFQAGRVAERLRGLGSEAIEEF